MIAGAAASRAESATLETSPSRLQADLAARILRRLKEQGAGVGHRLVELELCQQFGVSRTPVRGALKLLASQGCVEARANRGFVLLEPVTDAPPAEPINLQEEEDRRLIAAIAEARNTRRLSDEFAQQEICRLFGAKLPTAIRVLRRLAELGLVERKPGNGWLFVPSIDSPRAQAESYAFRSAVEPALVLQPTFELDRAWLAATRAAHVAFRKKRWRDSLAVEFYDMNAAFHEGLARCSGNRYMLSAVQQQNQLRSFLNYHWEYGVQRVHASIDEHLLIIDTLAAGENARVADLMRDHLATSAAEAGGMVETSGALPGNQAAPI